MQIRTLGRSLTNLQTASMATASLASVIFS